MASTAERNEREPEACRPRRGPSHLQRRGGRAGGWALDGAWERRALRLWTAGMVLWGVARLGLLALVKPADPPGLGAQMHADLDVTFALVSAVYVVAGILLWRGAAAMGTGRDSGSPS